jgi:hypothetical protein
LIFAFCQVVIVNIILVLFHFFLSYPELFTMFPENQSESTVSFDALIKASGFPRFPRSENGL